MRMTSPGFAMLQGFEGCRLTAYPDVAGIWTIGYGSTRYADRRRVVQGDAVTQLEADKLFRDTLVTYEQAVDDVTRDDLTGRQFDALVSLTYNIGPTAYRGSTLRRVVNLDPADPAITEAFTRWNKAGGAVVPGLLRRRRAEARWYFS